MTLKFYIQFNAANQVIGHGFNEESTSGVSSNSCVREESFDNYAAHAARLAQFGHTAWSLEKITESLEAQEEE